MTVDERMYQLLVEIDDLSRETDEDCKLPLYSDSAVEEMYKLIRHFMNDMGNNLIKVQTVDEFVEYIAQVSLTGRDLVPRWAEGFKKEKGYE